MKTKILADLSVPLRKSVTMLQAEIEVRFAVEQLMQEDSFQIVLEPDENKYRQHSFTVEHFCIFVIRYTARKSLPEGPRC